MMLVFGYSIASRGKRFYAIYIPRHLEGYAFTREEGLVIAVPLEMSNIMKPRRSLGKVIEALKEEVEEIRKHLESMPRVR